MSTNDKTWIANFIWGIADVPRDVCNSGNRDFIMAFGKDAGGLLGEIVGSAQS